MSANKATVEKYMDGFKKGDHEQILSCLTEDVEWLMPGGFYLHGKPAFDKEIANPNFTGKPVIRTTRIVEENDVVVAEGTVRATFAAGGILHAVFCDVFEMKEGKIKKLISYVVALHT